MSIVGQAVMLGESGGNTLTVTAPTGSTVTATKDGVTKTATEVDGVWTFKGLEGGTWTVTATLNDNTATATATFDDDEEVSLSYAPTASTTAQSGMTYTNGLSGLDAETVSAFAQAISDNSAISSGGTTVTSEVYVDFGDIHRKVSVGDQVTLALNGSSYTFDVIGFNHDDLTDVAVYGKATATGKAGITFQMHNLFATGYHMNSSSTNVGGWNSSVMRTSTMATMKGYLPSAWQSIIKPVNKKTSCGNKSSILETVSDSCFLLSEVEIFGSWDNSVQGEGMQYTYYKAGNSKVKNWTGSGYRWWERSPYKSSTNAFCYVTESGVASTLSAVAMGTVCVAFGFCV